MEEIARPRETAQEPGGRDPAPGTLRLIQDFVNSFDITAGVDRLFSADELRRWLVGKALMDPAARIRPDEHHWALTVREAVRELLLGNAGEPVDPDAVPTLTSAARTAWLTVAFDVAGRATLISEAPGVNGAIGGILAAVFQAMADGTWFRLKACRNPICQRAFFDRSKNRSGMWCAMSACGNREKARRFRRRRRVPKEVLGASSLESPPS